MNHRPQLILTRRARCPVERRRGRGAEEVGVDLGLHKTRSQVDTLEFDARPPGLGRFASAWR